MNPRRNTASLVREVPLVTPATPVAAALRRMGEAALPAVPVVDDAGRCVGLFGEQEVIRALFPGATVAAHLDTELVAVDANASDAQIAEAFLDHRVLVVPVVEAGRLAGAITRADFTQSLAPVGLADASTNSAITERVQIAIGVLTFVGALIAVVVLSI